MGKELSLITEKIQRWLQELMKQRNDKHGLVDQGMWHSGHRSDLKAEFGVEFHL